MKHSRKIVFLVVGFMAAGSFAWATERQGAEVVVSLKSGDETHGELLAVKKDFLALSSDSPGVVRDESIRVQDIREVRIVRRSKAGTGMLIGLLAGAGAGALIGYADGDDDPGILSFSAGQKAGIGAAAFGLTGLVIGSIVGAASGADTSYRLADAPKHRVDSTLAELSQHAKVPGLQ